MCNKENKTADIFSSKCGVLSQVGRGKKKIFEEPQVKRQKDPG